MVLRQELKKDVGFTQLEVNPKKESYAQRKEPRVVE